MRSFLAKPLGILLVGAALAASPAVAHAMDEPSSADVESARAAFLQGLEMRDKNHDARGAAERFKAAFSLVPTPRIGFELGVTYKMLGNLVDAHAAFLAVDRLPVRKNESAEAKKARDDARTQADELEPKIPELTIHLTGDGQISVDGEPLRRDALAIPRKLNPGRHVIQVLLDGEARSQKVVDLREGDKKSIDLETPSGKTPVIPPPPPGGSTTWTPPGSPGWVPPGEHEKPNPARPVAFTIMGVSAGIGAGVGIYAIIAVGTAKKDCDPTCNADFAGHKSTAMTLSIVADVFFGAALVSGIVGLVMPRMIKDEGPEVGFTPLPGGGFLSTGGEVLIMHWKAIVTTAAMALIPGALVSCTIYASTSLSGLGEGSGTDSGADTSNGCRNILTTVSKCGSCLEANAGTYANALCAHNSNNSVLSDMESCAKNPSVNNYDCNTFFPQSDAALSIADAEGALASNVRVTAGVGCESLCQYAFLTYSGCSGQTMQTADASACGACVTEKCRPELAACVKKSDLDPVPITNCAANGVSDCVTPNCAQLVALVADGGSHSTCSIAAYACVKSKCASDCPL